MARLLKRLNANIYVDGLHLLALCEKLVVEATAAAAAGAGTPGDPYTMSGPGQWIARWRAAPRDPDTYYKLAGRLILKNARLYVGDIGPAYLKAANQEDAAAKAKAQFLKDTRRDNGPILPVANFGVNAEQAWLKRNTNDDPTYRSGAQRIVDPGLIFEDSTKTLERYGGTRPAPWNEIRRSPELAKAIRTLLRGDKLALNVEAGKFDRDYSRKQSMLPVFAMAIFLAEPARNKRAWPINLMLLDLAQAGTPGYTWDAILWHPEAIHPAAHGQATPVVGPLGREASERKLVTITQTDKLHLVGGILPASPTGGGERGKPSLFKEAKPLAPQAIAHGAVQSPGSLEAVPFDFIHQKEIDVLLKWLLRHPTVAGSWTLVDGNKVPAGQLLPYRNVFSASVNGDVDTTQRLQTLRQAIHQRITTFDFH